MVLWTMSKEELVEVQEAQDLISAKRNEYS